MFHNSTTLHHRSYQMTALTGRESRVLHVNWFAKKKLQSAVIWDYMRGPRKLARLYSWSFGWPLITKGFDLSMKGLGKAADGIEWAGYTAMEGAKGAAQMTALPVGMLAYSRLRAIKRFLWDVPIATVSAVIRTPIALAASPLEVIQGVRDAVTSIPKNTREIFNSLRQLNLMDTIHNTRKAITDVILPPIKRPVQSVMTPGYELGKTVFGAEWQTVQTGRRAITETIPAGFSRLRSAPQTASAVLAEKKAVRAAAKAVLEQEKEEKRAALKAAVAEDKGEATGAQAGGGAMRKAA